MEESVRRDLTKQLNQLSNEFTGERFYLKHNKKGTFVVDSINFDSPLEQAENLNTLIKDVTAKGGLIELRVLQVGDVPQICEVIACQNIAVISRTISGEKRMVCTPHFSAFCISPSCDNKRIPGYVYCGYHITREVIGFRD